jgi:putative superfamily III holin-X
MSVDRSLADLFQDIVRNVQEIIRAEVSLAKAEVREETSKALWSITWLVAGAAAGVLALVFALWTAAYALALVWPIWAATMAVAAILAVTAAGLLLSGKQRLTRVHPTPERTLETMKENVAWARQSTK